MNYSFSLTTIPPSRHSQATTAAAKLSSTYQVSHSYDPDFLTMALPYLSPTTLPHHRPLTPRQIKAGNKQLTSLNVTAPDPHSLMGLPRELRDEIFWLAVQDKLVQRGTLSSYLDPVQPSEISPKSPATSASRRQASTGLERSSTTAHTIFSETKGSATIAAVTN